MTLTMAFGRAICQASWKVSAPPAISSTRSAPLPSVSARTFAAASSWDGSRKTSASPSRRANASRSGSMSIKISFIPGCSRRHISVQSPAGPAPITATCWPASICEICAAQYPVDSRSPVSSAASSLTPSGMRLSPCSTYGTRTYSACPPSMRRPSDHPPRGSLQLLTKPFLQ